MACSGVAVAQQDAPATYQQGALRPGIGLGIGSDGVSTVVIGVASLGVFYWDYLLAGTSLTYQSGNYSSLQWSLYNVAYLPITPSFFAHAVLGGGRLFYFDYENLWHAYIGTGPTFHLSRELGLDLRATYNWYFDANGVVDSGLGFSGGVFFMF